MLRVLVLSFPFFLSLASAAQDVSRDPIAVTLLGRTAAALGTVPQDAVLTGTVSVTSGSSSTQGQCSFLTRGLTQTAERVTVGGKETQLVTSGYQALLKNGTTVVANNFELATTGLSPVLPSVIIAAALNDSDYNVEYLGIDSAVIPGAYEVRISKRFSDIRNAQKFSGLSTRTLWLDSTTFLPLRLSFVRRFGGGVIAPFQIDYLFSDYKPVSGILVPFSISENLNGLPWISFSIQGATFNVGLTDSDFAME